jgi:hypothetical protein
VRHMPWSPEAPNAITPRTGCLESVAVPKRPPYSLAVVDQFKRGMGMMRKHDRQVQEDGFALVKQVAAEHVADLISAYAREEDQGLCCWLLELIGEARSPEALPVLGEPSRVKTSPFMIGPGLAYRSWTPRRRAPCSGMSSSRPPVDARICRGR